MRISLRPLLLVSWFCVVAVCVALFGLAQETENLGYQAQIEKSIAQTQLACREVHMKFVRAETQGVFTPAKRLQFQNAVLEMVLDRYEGIEGGFWNTDERFTAYSYPTYEGGGPKTDVPDAEKHSIEGVITKSLALNHLATASAVGKRDATQIVACPTGNGEAVWIMQRLSLVGGQSYDDFRVHLYALMIFVIAACGAFSFLLWNWSSGFSKTVTALDDESFEEVRALPQTWNADLNRVTSKFQSLLESLKASRAANEMHLKTLSRADRVRTLGELAAGLAHDIRNPLATIRLKFDNLSVEPEKRLPEARRVILEQISKVDHLVEMILSMTRPFDLKIETVDLKTFFDQGFVLSRASAQKKSIELSFKTSIEAWRFDRFQMERALANIIDNSISFTPDSGSITVSAFVRDSSSALVFRVCDTGPGLPDNLKSSIFSTSQSQRPGGTGLGLIIAREIVEAHRGRIRYVEADENALSRGACFEMEIPVL